MKRCILLFLSIIFTFGLSACSGDNAAGIVSISCISDTDCPVSQTCDMGICVDNTIITDGDTNIDGDKEESAWSGECRVDLDCDDGYLCRNNFCLPENIVEDGDDTDIVTDGDDDLIESESITDGDEDEEVGKPCKDNSDCNDSLFCNGIETCGDDHFCVAGDAPCNDGVECSDDVCNEEKNECSVEPNHTRCDDNDPCNGIEYCDIVLGCQPGTAMICNDEIDCTQDSCIAMSGCLYEPDHTQCSDGVECTEDVCDINLAKCRNEVKDTNCDDSIECTTDTCDLELGCKYELDDTFCNDNASCTVDRCVVDTGCQNNGDDNACDADQFCDPDVAPNGSATGCAPRNPCTTVEDCNDNVECTLDVCDPERGCVNTPLNANCSDDHNCTVDICDPINDCIHTPDNTFCDDRVPCTTDSCSISEGCVHALNHDFCNDGIICTTETCTTQYDCVYEAHNTDCNDNITCTADTCEIGAGCKNVPDDSMCAEGQICDPSFDCRTPPACTTDPDCDDDDVCNGSETCVSNNCVDGTPLNCDDGFSCSIDSCDSDTGCVHTLNHQACDDHDDCTGDICVADTVDCHHEVIKDSDNDYYIDENCSGGNDCDDNNAAVHPNHEEICDDGFDNDCDGNTDQEQDICQPCSDGCPAGMECCSGTCTDILSNNLNCGGCDVPCSTACSGGTCLPPGVCADALNQLITQNVRMNGLSTCSASDNFNSKNHCPSASRDASGGDRVFAIKPIPGNEMRITMYPGYFNQEDALIYLLTDCNNIDSCTEYDWGDTDTTSLSVTLDSSNTGEIIYVVVDYAYGRCDTYDFEVNFDYESSSCETTGSMHHKTFALIFLMFALFLFTNRKTKKVVRKN